MGILQYRDVLKWRGEGTPATIDPVTGDPVPGTPGSEITAMCRYENFRGRSSREWLNRDGETVLQRGTIYVKKGEQCPEKFETVTVESPEFGLVFKGEVLNTYQGQLNYTLAV